MKISIHDYANNRIIIARVPEYLVEAKHADTDDEAIFLAIINALGLNSDECEYMLGDFDVQIDLDVLNGGHGYNHNVIQGIEQLTQDFEADARQALADEQA